MDYKKTALKSDLSVDDVVSIHYFEYTVDYAFSGELHDFWEIVYADKNDFFITADSKEFILPQGNMYIHKPMEFHNIRANGKNASNSVIVSFSSSCSELYNVSGKIIPCGNNERRLMGDIIEEGRKAFSTPLGDPYTMELVRSEKSEFGAEQLIRIKLEELLIGLVRKSDDGNALFGQPNFSRRKDEVRLRSICEFLEKNIEKNIASEDIQKEFFVSESSLQKLFQAKVGCGVIQYFQKMKIDRAKLLIRERKYNFSEISDRLGFSSIHYFSRRFKAITGMTPSQYSASVRSLNTNK